MIEAALRLAYLALWMGCAVLVWLVLLPVSALVVTAVGSTVGVGGSLVVFALAVLCLRRQERARC